MSRRKIKAGSTSVMAPIFAQDTSSTTGAGLGSLVFNSSGLTAKYRRQGDSTWTTITLATATLGTFTSGGFIADGFVSGGYEVGIPDAALATGAKWAQVCYQGATNMLPVLLEFELDAVDYQDATRFGLAAIPNAAAAAAGGLPTIGAGAGQINVDGAGNASANVIKWNAHAVPAENTNGVPIVDNRSTALRIGAAQSGGATAITLDAAASAANNYYTGLSVSIIGGTGAGQAGRVITGYAGGTKVATVTPAWATNPDNTSVFALVPATADVQEWYGVVNNRPDVGQVFGDVRGKVLGSSATAIVGPGAWVFNDAGASVAPAATALSNATWTNTLAALVNTLAGHDPGGTLASAASQTSILNALPTNFSALAIDTNGDVTFNNTSIGTVTTLANLPAIPANWLTAAGIAAGALDGKGDWLLASGYTAPDNADIALIKAKTDNLPASPAAVGSAMTLAANGLDAVLVESGIVAGAGLTNDAGTQLTTINARQGLALCMSVLCGLDSGGGTGTIIFRPAGNPAANARVTTSGADNSGNRGSVNLKVPT